MSSFGPADKIKSPKSRGMENETEKPSWPKEPSICHLKELSNRMLKWAYVARDREPRRKCKSNMPLMEDIFLDE